MKKRTLWGIILTLGLILGYVGLRLFMIFYTDWLWFDHLRYGPAFVTMALAKAVAFATFWGAFIALAGGNLWVARYFGRRTRAMPLEVIAGDTLPMLPYRIKRERLMWGGIVVGVGFFMGLGGTPIWTSALRYLHPVEFGITDPIFKRELGFYVFNLPLYTFVYGWLIVALLAAALLVLLSYHQDRSIRNNGATWSSAPHVRAHISALGAAFAFLMAWGYWLKEYELLYSFRKTTFTGAGYTDIHAQIFAYRLMLVLSVGLAVLLLYNLRFKGWRLPRTGAIGYVGSILLFSWLVPILFEQFIVKPNELTLETPYIRHSIAFTRRAYGLDKVEEVSLPAESNLTFQDIQNNLPTVRSIPLWDRRPLMDTYSQLQEIRSYYRFGSVDVDRYRIDGQYRQVMLAAREFSRHQLAMQGETWVNRHFVYTHGYGICMSPASEIASEGLPKFYIKDIPPVSSVGPRIDRPEIYYGENMQDYVIVRTKTQEFDYPRGDENVYTSYQGRGGVAVNSLFRRIAFAFRFGDPYLLVTDNLKPESRILFDRHIGRRFREDGPKRFEKLAPFLHFDRDPYLVAVEGRLIWVQDAYTATSMYPYSEPYGRPYVRETNYIRNSVKITLDAYNGTVTFYVWEPEDPLIRSYMEIFPALFRPKETMPEALRAHMRYPIDLFQIQASLYNTYHMTSPQVFYNREDVWEPAVQIYGISERPQTMSPYYVIVKLPDAQPEEFVLMLPATPTKKANMIAWLSARCDGPNYGRLMVYKLPKEKLIYGPMLIERRIDQNTDVSREITLWSQRGSDVIRGNLLVIPIETSFIYVEPLYLRATQSGMPELKRVLVVHGEKLAMAENLDQALFKVFSDRAPPPVSVMPKAPPHPSAAPEGLKAMTENALQHLETAQERLRAGDFTGYGEFIQKLREALIQLNKQVKTNGK